METVEDEQLALRNRMLSDETALKASVVTCFSNIFGSGMVSEDNLNRPLTRQDVYFYSFGHGHLVFRPLFIRNTLYKIFYDWYFYAEASVSQETRDALFRDCETYDEYMTACIFLSIIKSGYSVRVSTNTGFLLKVVVEAQMWWVEKMFQERIPVNSILFALTRDVIIHTDEEYLKFRDDVKDIPSSWLQEIYPTTIHASY